MNAKNIVNTQELTTALTSMVEHKIPTFVWGAPGIGKSSIVKQIAKEKNIGFIDLRLALMDPTDLKGIPFYDAKKNQALWAEPSFLPHDKNSSGILFLDELNSAPPAVQASAYQLILDRAIGEYQLPDGWAIVAAGNRESDRGVIYKMPSPLANRFVHFEMGVNVNDWKEWAYKAKIDERVIAYIAYKNEELFTFDATLNEKSFATPRSWEFVDKILKSGVESKLLIATIGGAIGHERAVNFLAFAKVMNRLPDLELILNGNFDEHYPEEVDVLYALSAGLVSKLLHYHDDTLLNTILDYTLELKSEFSVMIIQDLQRSGIKMEHLSSYDKWVRQFAYLIM